MPKPRRIAVIGAGIAGLSCARTLAQAGHDLEVFEKDGRPGGRMSSLDTPFGSFDHGAQYFTIRDPRLSAALATAPGVCRRWSANAVRVLDSYGQLVEAAKPGGESHWVATPEMTSLAAAWAEPLARSSRLRLATRVHRIERESGPRARWCLLAEGERGEALRLAGYDQVLLALPVGAARDLLRASVLPPALLGSLTDVRVSPCWSLMLAYPQAQQPEPTRFGPQWNAARSIHHRLAWVCRESSKPGRSQVERWTAQASPAWSEEHLDDDHATVLAKLLKAFGEVTGIRAQPGFSQVHRWRQAKTVKPLGQPCLWDASTGIGLAGDWCLGHRVEDAFVSGLELALRVA